MCRSLRFCSTGVRVDKTQKNQSLWFPHFLGLRCSPLALPDRHCRQQQQQATRTTTLREYTAETITRTNGRGNNRTNERTDERPSLCRSSACSSFGSQQQGSQHHSSNGGQTVIRRLKRRSPSRSKRTISVTERTESYRIALRFVRSSFQFRKGLFRQTPLYSCWK